MPTEITEKEVAHLSGSERKALLLSSEKTVARNDPFWLIESGYFKIKTKAGTSEVLTLKPAQQKLHNLVKRLWEENKMIRIFILKARQTGITTWVQALVYSIVSQSHNVNAVDIADDVDGSNYIFEMSKYYHKNLPAHLKTATKKSNEKKLEFEGSDSQILVDTASNKDAGRKYTFRIAHLSEYAFYPSAETLMVGLSQSVPGLPRTIIIKETTANGFNFAKDEWDMIENGESDYIGVFIPWYWENDYKMSFDGEFTIGDSSLGVISEDEQSLYERMLKENIDFIEERLNWRRWCVRNNCGMGSDKDRIANFKQEYPSFPAEAFKASGECYFDQEELIRQLELKPQPLFKVDIVYADFKFEIRKSEDGVFCFYETPQVGLHYVIGGDGCSGSGSDNAALVARRKDNNKIVATYQGKIDPDELAHYAYLLGGLLNFATVAIENDKFGFAANEKLKKIYKNVYVQRTFDERSQKITEKFGWDTDPSTRPMMLAQMQQEIRQKALLLPNIKLIKECLVFIVHPNGKAAAQLNCNDDFVIACAISGVVRNMERPKKTEAERQAATSKVRADPRSNAGFGFKKG